MHRRWGPAAGCPHIQGHRASGSGAPDAGSTVCGHGWRPTAAAPHSGVTEHAVEEGGPQQLPPTVVSQKWVADAGRGILCACPLI
eukprot:1161092-Pelagomonas_calceolata.AAC.6